MKIIGLTGGVASGKNYICEIFKELGAKIFDADYCVHEILQNNQEVFEKISKNFPFSIENNQINRKKLGEIVFQNQDKLKILEEIIHPIIRKKYQEFLIKSQENGAKIIALNVPLLIEKRGYDYDFLIAINTDFDVRKKRFVERELSKNNLENIKKLEEKFENIAKNQISDEKRHQEADFIIDGALDKESLKSQLEKIINLVEREH